MLSPSIAFSFHLLCPHHKHIQTHSNTHTHIHNILVYVNARESQMHSQTVHSRNWPKVTSTHANFTATTNDTKPGNISNSALIFRCRRRQTLNLYLGDTRCTYSVTVWVVHLLYMSYIYIQIRYDIRLCILFINNDADIVRKYLHSNNWLCLMDISY